MSKGTMNLQDSFLNQVRRENQEVKILLVNGAALRGIVRGFDNFTVVLSGRNGAQHLIYKHAIAQLVSFRGARHQDSADETASGGAEAAPADGGADAPEPVAAATSENSGTPAPRENKPGKGASGFNRIDLSQVKLPG